MPLSPGPNAVGSSHSDLRARLSPGRTIRVAVASGKGGTGKTLVSTNLARLLVDLGASVTYLDCDVEAPDGHVFLHPAGLQRHDVSVPVAEIDASLCGGCGACAQACRFGAILSLPGKSVVFPDLCRGCGGCIAVCRKAAIHETARPVGVVEVGHSGQLAVYQGRLEIGRSAEHEVVRAVQSAAADATGWVIMDSPPGVGCPVVETVRGADIALLVTEPTPAGIHDLALAVELSRDLGVPCGVVLNRAGANDGGVKRFCGDAGVPLLAEIPEDVRIARAYARGRLVIDEDPVRWTLFEQLVGSLAGLIEDTGTGMSARRLDRVRPPSSVAPAAVSPPPSEAVRLHPMAPPIDELVVLSGKGGTGKTTIAACLAALADEVALVDADVDAANLHLLLDPCPRERRPFIGGQVAVVDPRRCLGCGLCADDCRFDAIHLEDAAHPDAPSASVGVVDPAACEGCGVCVDTCPEGAAALVAHHSGHWFIADTELGPFTHARLNPGGRNSGGLVARVRDEGRALGRIEDRGIVITDGPPGIGCPAIAALTGADRVLLVTEPTLSGLHDLRRIVVLAHQLGVPAAVCINKTDLNPALTAQLAVDASYLGVPVLGRVRYDTAVVEAQRAGTRVTEYAPHGPAAADIRELWRRVHAWVVGDACMAGLQARQSTASSDTEHQGDER